MAEFSDEDLVIAIGQALANGRLDVVPGIVAVFALQNPGLAEGVRDVVRAACAVDPASL